MLTSITLADVTASMLIGWWMAIVLVALYAAWGWLVSSLLDKDARYFNLKHRTWNGVHMAAGVVGLAAFLFIPVPGVNVLGSVIVLVAPVLVYWKVRNQEVPESQRFRLSSDRLKERMEARKRARAARAALVEFTDSKGAKRHAPSREDPQFTVHMMVEDLLVPALEARAARVELAVTPKGTAVTQVIDGITYKRDPLASEQAIGVVDYIKGLAGLDVEDRRRRQTGEFTMTGPNGRDVVHVTTAGSSSGLLLRMDFNLQQQVSKPFDGIGLLPSQIEALQQFAEPHNRHGIILIGAPKGQGLSTTAYSLLNRHDAYTANIKTLEREVLLEIDGVDHVHWNPADHQQDYATNLQSILRRDPDIVLTDVVQDAETAKIVAEPGMEGPLIYVQQREGNIIDQIRSWVKLVGDVKKATRPLRAVLNQRLIRTLCPNCRQAYQPTPEQIKKLNLPANKVSQLYRASGKVQEKNRIENCPVCGGTGYLGQTGIYEVMIVDDEARKILASGDLKSALAHARRNKMIYLQEAALSKVVSGETSIEEVLRVTAPPKKKDSDSSAAA